MKRRCRVEDCPEHHCRLDGWRHVTDNQHTCPTCIADVRANLTDIGHLVAYLPDQAARGGTDGHLEAGRPIPGGEATVLLAASGYGGNLDDRYNPDWTAADPIPPLLMLATWEDDWRITFGHPAAPHRATVASALTYLDRHLHHGAQHHDAFDEFAEDVRSCVRRLEAVLHRGDPTWRGVPCVQCGTALLRDYSTRHGFLDSYTCPGCDSTATAAQYHYAVGVQYRAHAPALTAADMAVQYDVKPTTLRAWASLGKVRKRGRDLAGRVLYDVDDTLEQTDTDPAADRERSA